MKKAEAMEEESLAYKLAVYFIDSHEKGRVPAAEPWQELQHYQDQNGVATEDRTPTARSTT